MLSTLDPTLDVIFKLLLASPESRDVLASLLDAVLRPSTPIAHVEVLDPEIRKEEAADKGIVLDLHVRLGDGTLLDIEMQAEKRPAFRGRALLYWARMYSSQLTRGDEYESLRPAIQILFLDYAELPGQRLHSLFRILEVHEHHPFSDAFELHVVELPKLAQVPDEQRAEEGRLLGWARFFGAKTDDEMEAAAMSDPMIAKARDNLHRLSTDPAARELARKRELALLTYRLELATAREQGREEGLEKGLEKGREEGIQRFAAAVLSVLEARSITVPDEVRRRVLACTDESLLTAWLSCAATASSARDLLLED